MKASAIKPSSAVRKDPLPMVGDLPPVRFSDYWELTKPRLSLLSVITALVGFLAVRPSSVAVLAHLFLGTALAAAGAAVLNQWMERGTDARMRRTRERPIPSGAVPPRHALLFGAFLSLAGVGHLFYWINSFAAALAAATIVTYVLLYTPLKSRSGFSLEIGAVSGALPPLIGWVAAEGGISTLGWILFGILYLWQMPHFLAIAWLYREDYASVNFPMMTVVDATGKRAALYSLIHTVALFALTLLPFFLGLAGWLFLLATLLSGAVFLRAAFRFYRSADRNRSARVLFFASILYLPVTLCFLVLDRWLIVM